MNPSRPRECRHFFGAFVLSCFLLGSFGEAQPKPIRRVLIFYEAGTTYPAVRLIDRGIRAALQTSPYELEVYREYMDTILFPDPANQQQFRDFYISKYRNRRPDVIITVGPSPLKFMMETHRTAFSGVPIVFCVPDLAAGPTPVLDSDFTGVEDEVFSAETVEAALRLQPGTRHIIVVGGTSFFDTKYTEIARERLKPYEGNLEVSYLTTLTMPDLLERLKHLPKGTIVLVTTLTQDAAGARFTGAESSAIVAAAANAPVFTLSDVNIGHGEVGGKFSLLLEYGRIAGGIAQRLLEGEKPEQIPRVEAPTSYTFDWRALQRWGLKDKNLPPGSIVLNRPPTAWESYKWYIVGGISLMLVQALLIFGLLWQHRRRAKAEGQSRESERRFRAVADTAPVLIWMSGMDKLFTYFNTPWLDFTGRSMDEELGNGWTGGVHPDDFQRCLDTYTQSFDRRERFRMEYRLRRYDGEYRWLLDVGVPRFQSSSFAGYIGCALDVTERKLAEDKLREYERAVEGVEEMIVVVNREYRCLMANKEFLKKRNSAEEQVVGHFAHEFVNEQAYEAVVKPKLDECFQGKVVRFELRYTYPHIGERDLFVSYYPVEGSNGIDRAVCVLHDITDRKLAEKALSTVSRRLIQAQEQERTRIARELHDDINQRLAMVQVDLNQLRENPPNSLVDLRERMDGLRKRVSDTSNEVQAISHRLHSSKLEYLGLVAACKSFCTEIAERRKIQIEFNAKVVPSATPEDHALTIFRVLQESLQNAIKHSGARRVDVHLGGVSGEIQLTVRDNGVGFDVDKAMSNRGLGLVSMRERVGLVNGTILIASKPMSGTEINVRVPVSVANSEKNMRAGAA